MLLFRRRWRRELEDEMRLHAELRADARQFGNELRLRERSQEVWGWTWLESLGQDVRHGLRLLARTPLATTLALLSLALGIGANTAIFSLMNAIMLRSLPVAQPEQLVHVLTQPPNSSRLLASFTNPLWEQVRDHQQALAGTFAWNFRQVPMRDDGQQRPVEAVLASGGYFATLGVKPEIGRVFGAEIDHGGCQQVAVLSDAFWKSHYARSPQALGQELKLANQSFEVIGVTPPGFFGMDVGTQFDVVLPLCAQALIEPMNMLRMRDAWWLQVAGRLPRGVSVGQVQAELAAEMPAWLQASVPLWPGQLQAIQSFLGRRARVQPLAGGVSFLRGNYQLPLEILLGVAGLVLLVACANLAGLMLARAAARREEVATRQALGASRARLIRQMLTESLVLAAGGAGLGAVLALWGCQWLERYWSTQARAIHLHLTPDARVLGFAFALTIITALLCGLAPAWTCTRREVMVRGGVGMGQMGRAGRRLAVAQIAVSLLLLAGSGLFLRSFLNLARVDLGFDASHVVLVRMGMPATRHPSDAALLAWHQRDLEALRHLPGIEKVAESFIVPTSGVQWDDALTSPARNVPDAFMNAVSPGYFATMQVLLLQGRDFAASDDGRAPAVVILSQSAARGLFPRGNALGQQVRIPHSEDVRPAQIVGIVADAKYDSSLRTAAPPTAYYPLAQLLSQFRPTNYELRTALPETAVQPAIRGLLARTDPDANFTITTLDAMVGNTLKPERLLALLSVLFGGLALLLTALGLYGLASYHANRRRHEFGVRMALGARARAVEWLALRELAAVVVAGLAVGLLATWLSARVLEALLGKLLFGLHAADGTTFCAASALLAVLALTAAWLPARRASRADPLQALREE